MPKGIPASGKRVSRKSERLAMRPTIIDPDQFYWPEEAAAARGKSLAGLYRTDLASGRITANKDGSRTRILGADIIRANREDARVPA
jgi:hypothetical protein